MNNFSKRKIRDNIGELIESIEKSKDIFPFEYFAGVIAGLNMARQMDSISPFIKRRKKNKK